MADILGTSPNRLAKTILGRQKGGVIIDQDNGMGLAETMLASRDLLVTEMKKLDQLAKAAETGGDEQALEFRAQLELVAQLQAQIKGAQTEIARALSSFRIPARDGTAAGAMRGKDLTTLLEDYGGVDDIRDMAKAYNQQGDNVAAKAAISRAGSKYKKFTDAFYEAWINILLSNPVTHTKKHCRCVSDHLRARCLRHMQLPALALCAGRVGAKAASISVRPTPRCLGL